MSQWGFYYNQQRCLSCKACTVSCKSWNDFQRGDIKINVSLSWLSTPGLYANPSSYQTDSAGDGRQNYALSNPYFMKEFWRRVTRTEYGTNPPNVDLLSTSIGCNHCNNPACIQVCPMQIIYKEPVYGAVLVDNTNCISCGKCQDACPWGAPQFYDPNFRSYTQADPARPKMTKCTLCYDRISAGLKPQCVASCLNRALDAGPMTALQAAYPGAWPATSVVNFPSDSVPSLGINTGPNIIITPRPLKVSGQGTVRQSYQ